MEQTDIKKFLKKKEIKQRGRVSEKEGERGGKREKVGEGKRDKDGEVKR